MPSIIPGILFSDKAGFCKRNGWVVSLLDPPCPTSSRPAHNED
jgi:hypothetical protein